MTAKLSITDINDLKTSVKDINDSNSFIVMLNPSSLSHNHSINYSSSEENKGAPLTSEARFSGYANETLDFEIVIDGTGVTNVNPAKKQKSKLESVSKQIEKLKKLIYKYEGEEHQPKTVAIVWGTLNFTGRLSTLKIDYTLFKPDGMPLRAKIKLGFKGFISTSTQALIANNSSPDLTHIIETKAGDTLALLCHKIYKDSSYHIEVAEHNNLTNFRDIKPGTKLYFPPIT